MQKQKVTTDKLRTLWQKEKKVFPVFLFLHICNSFQIFKQIFILGNNNPSKTKVLSFCWRTISFIKRNKVTKPSKVKKELSIFKS